MGRGLIVDGWLRLRGWARIGVLVSRLRMMLDDILATKIDNPDTSNTSSQAEERVIEVVKWLVELNGLDQ